MENEAVLMKLWKGGSFKNINDAQVEYWCGSATGFEADGCPYDRSANKLVAPGIFAQIRVWTRANKVNNLGLITQTCRNTVNTGYFRQLSHDFQLQHARGTWVFWMWALENCIHSLHRALQTCKRNSLRLRP